MTAVRTVLWKSNRWVLNTLFHLSSHVLVTTWQTVLSYVHVLGSRAISVPLVSTLPKIGPLRIGKESRQNI